MVSSGERHDVPTSFTPPTARHAIRDQEELWRQFLAMADAVVASLEKAVAAICDGRIEVVAEVKDAEQESDREEIRIERECLRILALYEPVATDLRRLATMMKVSRDYERIADLSARVARRARKLARKSPGLPAPEVLAAMARDVLDLARETTGAMARGDARRAREIIDDDRAIDRQHRQIRKRLKDEIRREPSQLSGWLQLIGAARNLERIADHVTDIARMIVFLEEGIFIRRRMPTTQSSP